MPKKVIAIAINGGIKTNTGQLSQEASQAIPALIGHGFDVRLVGSEGDIDWCARHGIKLAGSVEPASEAIYFDTRAVGWPGWQTAVATALLQARGVQPEQSKACPECVSTKRKRVAITQAVSECIRTIREQEDPSTEAASIINSAALGLAMSLHSLDTVTKELVETDIMESGEAGKYMPADVFDSLLANIGTINATCMLIDRNQIQEQLVRKLTRVHQALTEEVR